MLVDLREILRDADEKGYAVPAFNVYNMETVMGVIKACEEAGSPVIMQYYSRLASTGFGDFISPIVTDVALKTKIPVCLHLDHGAGFIPATIALKNGATGIMVDFSKLPLEENIENTRKVVTLLDGANIGVEGELGFIGKACDGVPTDYTTVADAKKFVDGTGVACLAVAVGTAHGRYKQAPKLAIERIREIKEEVKIPLVLHGGSGVPDAQIKQAIEAGIRKVNFGTDLCYAFLDPLMEEDKNKVGIDLIMAKPIESVKQFCISKIKLLGSENRV